MSLSLSLNSDEIDVKSSGTGNSKKVVFGSNILPHDIAYKVKHVCKMVAKGKVVDVTIERKKDQANTYVSLITLMNACNKNIMIIITMLLLQLCIFVLN